MIWISYVFSLLTLFDSFHFYPALSMAFDRKSQIEKFVEFLMKKMFNQLRFINIKFKFLKWNVTFQFRFEHLIGSFEQIAQSWPSTILGVFFEELDSKVLYLSKGQSRLRQGGFVFLVMQKIASVSIMAMSLNEKCSTLFCFVSKVKIIVLSQLVRSMGKFASGIIRTESWLHELFTQF